MNPEIRKRDFGPLSIARTIVRGMPGVPDYTTYAIVIQVSSLTSIQLLLVRFDHE